MGKLIYIGKRLKTDNTELKNLSFESVAEYYHFKFKLAESVGRKNMRKYVERLKEIALYDNMKASELSQVTHT